MTQFLVNINYSVTLDNQSVQHEHKFRVKMDVSNPDPAIGTPFANIDVLDKGTFSTPPQIQDLETATGIYVQNFVDCFGITMSITSITLQKYSTTIDGSAIFVSAADLTNATVYPNLSGTDLGSNIAASGGIITFIDSRGRVSKLYFQESILSGNGQVGVTDAPTAYQNLLTYLGSSANIVHGVDTSEWVQFKLLSAGQNEAIWRKRYR